ncbi:MAG TPA: PP2C family protein-serine/threonine phosphatase [Acidimicrobiia bacterium]|nr:PP2C family protein-serine/threonine phosphatase [Acidimicrobiia bacterium]
MTSDPWILGRLEQAARWLYAMAVAMGGIEVVAAVAGLQATLAGDTQPFSFWGGAMMVATAAAARTLLSSPHPPVWSRYLLGLVGLASAAVVVRFLSQTGGPPGGLSGAASPAFTRPAANLALVLGLIVGGALGATSRRTLVRYVAQGAAVAAGTISSIVLVGVAYGDPDATGFPVGSQEMTLPAVIGTLGLVGAVLCSRPSEGLIRPVVSAGVGGVLLRRLLPVVLVVPPVLIGLLVFRTRFDTPGMLALVAVAFTAVLVAGLLTTARSLDQYQGSQQLAMERADRATTALTQVAPVITDLDRTLAAVEVDRVGRLEAAVRYSAASGMVAGDSLAVFAVGDQGLGLVMVDAAGHGAQPALKALRLRDCLVQALRLGIPPSQAVAAAIWVLDEPEDMATAAVMIADASTGKLRLTLAGHPPPLLDRGSAVGPVDRGGPLLHRQVMGSWEDQELELVAGDRLIFFTDGVADVFPRSSDLDEIAELAALLQRLGPASAQEAADACLTFAERAPTRRDDRAVVVLAMTEVDQA